MSIGCIDIQGTHSKPNPNFRLQFYRKYIFETKFDTDLLDHGRNYLVPSTFPIL